MKIILKKGCDDMTMLFVGSTVLIYSILIGYVLKRVDSNS